jgi:uncharacterized protein (DUF305 family)
MDDKLKYGLGGLLIGGLLVWVTAFTFIRTNSPGAMGMMGFRNSFQPNTMQNSNGIDTHFIEQMIPHHEDAITMAKIAKERAQKPEIKQLADAIITSQGQEIDQMKAWYQDWYGKEVPSGRDVMGEHGMMQGGTMHMGMMGNETDMTRLETASDFDKAFIEEMIPHHQMAVMMASMLKSQTQRPEMKELADDIINAQTKEIEEMRQWYQDWGYEQ